MVRPTTRDPAGAERREHVLCDTRVELSDLARLAQNRAGDLSAST
jgi:hypothetical protein